MASSSDKVLVFCANPYHRQAEVDGEQVAFAYSSQHGGAVAEVSAKQADALTKRDGYVRADARQAANPAAALRPPTKDQTPSPSQNQAPIMRLEGVGQKTAEKLAAIGIETVGQLLGAARTRERSAAIVALGGVSAAELAGWAEQAEQLLRSE